MFPPSVLHIAGEVILITDELLAPADFLLHRFLSDHMKGTKNAACVVASTSEDVGRWQAMAGRLSANTYLDSQLIMIDAISHVVPALESSSENQLKVLFTNLKEALCLATEDVEKDKIIILDDLSTLEWIGISIEEIIRFARAICALCRKGRVSLVIRHHIVTPGEPDELFRSLLQLCNHHLDVFPLTSGRSGSVSGQVALYSGPSPQPPYIPVPRSKAIQYRLTDTGSILFERGTGNGVL